MIPLAQPVLKIHYFVTMWDTPDPNNAPGSLDNTIFSGLVNTFAVPFLLGGFSEVQGLGTGTELETYHEGGHNDSEHRFFKKATYEKIVFKRGVTFSTDFWDWHHQTITAKRKARKSGTVIVLDRNQPFGDVPGVTLPGEHIPVGAWTFHGALPLKFTGPELAAAEGEGKNAVAIESFELHPEKVQRLSLNLIPGLADMGTAIQTLIGTGATAVAAGALAKALG